MGIGTASKPINKALSEKIQKLFECNIQITKFEIYSILNCDDLHSIEFTDLFTYFCWDFQTFKNNASIKNYFNNIFGENFMEFIESSNFFRVKKNIPNSRKIPLSSIEKDVGSEKEKGKPIIEIKENNEIIDTNASFNLFKIKLVIFLLSCDSLNDECSYNDKVYFSYFKYFIYLKGFFSFFNFG